jgi:hypothetical protein
MQFKVGTNDAHPGDVSSCMTSCHASWASSEPTEHEALEYRPGKFRVHHKIPTKFTRLCETYNLHQTRSLVIPTCYNTKVHNIHSVQTPANAYLNNTFMIPEEYHEDFSSIFEKASFNTLPPR